MCGHFRAITIWPLLNNTVVVLNEEEDHHEGIKKIFFPKPEKVKQQIVAQ